MRNIFFRNLHLFAGLGISPNPGRAVIQGKAAKAADLDTITPRQGVGHRIENHLDREFGVLRDQLGKPLRQPGDELRLGHARAAYFCSFSLAFSSAPRLVVPLAAEELSDASLVIASFCST